MRVQRRGQTFAVDDDSVTSSWNFWSLWADGEWEPELLAIVDERLGIDGCLLDIGAWVGPVTLWASREPARTIIALEPDPRAFSILAANLRDNRLGYPRVLAMQCAAGLKGGSTNLYSVREDGWGHSTSSTVLTTGHSMAVDEIDVAHLVRETRIDLVKMDIEGGERHLFPHLGPELRRQGVPLLLSVHLPLDELEPEWSRWDAQPLSGATESYYLTPL